MKRVSIVTWSARGCFFVRSNEESHSRFDAGKCFQVIQSDVMETLRAGKGHDGLEVDVIKKVHEAAGEHADLLRAQGFDVVVSHLT